MRVACRKSRRRAGSLCLTPSTSPAQRWRCTACPWQLTRAAHAALAAACRYPLLSMASLHVALGHLGEADAVLHEAVAVAQQRGDSACVAFCLSLLAQLQAATNNPRVRVHET